MNWLSRSLPAFAVTAGVLLIAAHASAQGFDRIYVGTKVEQGNIIGMNSQKVKLSKGVLDKEISVGQITEIKYAREPGELTLARSSAATGGYQSAVEALQRIDLDEVRREEIKQDIVYYLAYCKAKLAIAGEGDLRATGGELNRFVLRHKNSFHYYDAVETLGDILVAMGQFEHARKQYAILAATPWVDYKLKAMVLEGRALIAQKKYAEAIKRFDEALAIKVDTPEAKQKYLAATLGKATCLADMGKIDEAIKMVQDVITKADAEAGELHAQAYNALGGCYLKAGKQKDALLAFLHVDVLYSSYPAAHAEALYRLVPLWKSIGQGQRARQALELLTERYPNSRWAKQL